MKYIIALILLFALPAAAQRPIRTQHLAACYDDAVEIQASGTKVGCATTINFTGETPTVSGSVASVAGGGSSEVVLGPWVLNQWIYFGTGQWLSNTTYGGAHGAIQNLSAQAMIPFQSSSSITVLSIACYTEPNQIDGDTDDEATLEVYIHDNTSGITGTATGVMVTVDNDDTDYALFTSSSSSYSSSLSSGTLSIKTRTPYQMTSGSELRLSCTVRYQ